MAKVTVEELAVKLEYIEEQHVACQKRLNSNLEKLYDKMSEFVMKMSEDREEVLNKLATDRRETDEQMRGRPARIDAYTITALTAILTGLAVRLLL